MTISSASFFCSSESAAYKTLTAVLIIFDLFLANARELLLGLDALRQRIGSLLAGEHALHAL